MGKGKQPSVQVGDIFPTTNHGNVEIIKYENATRVTVMFQDGNTKLTSMMAIRLKSVKNFFTPTVRNIGYLGCDPKEYGEGKIVDTLEYRVWSSMLRRCYDTKSHVTKPYYAGCTVAEVWHNFKTFSDWYKRQHGCTLGWQVDKDLLVMGNKVYSPETCSLVPQEINNLLALKKKARGAFPVGVHYDKRLKKYAAEIGLDATYMRLGTFDTPEDAFTVYKTHKEVHVKSVAQKYKDVIPEAIYNNLMNFTVSITD